MPPQDTQTCTDRQRKRIFIAFGESFKRMHKAAAAADVRVGQAAVEAAAGRGVLWGQWRQASAFAGCDSKVSEQVWELYGNVYCGGQLALQK